MRISRIWVWWLADTSLRMGKSIVGLIYPGLCGALASTAREVFSGPANGYSYYDQSTEKMTPSTITLFTPFTSSLKL
jgi:hypothetical protein